MHQDLLKAEIAKNLKTGLVQGKNPRVLAQDIRKTFGSSQYNAERLMRTEMARVQTDAQMQSLKENGFDEYQFLALGNACEICRALDGKHFPVDKMMPGLNAPPMHPNCRCSTSAYMGREEFDQWLDAKSYGGYILTLHSPGSTKSFKKSLEMISHGKAGLDERRKNILKRIENTGDYVEYKNNTISIKDLAYLSAATNHEFALFRSKEKDILIRGDSKSCSAKESLAEDLLSGKYELVAHSHVDRGKLAASQDDRDTLAKLNQDESIIIGLDGEQKKYSQSVFND